MDIHSFPEDTFQWLCWSPSFSTFLYLPSILILTFPSVVTGKNEQINPFELLFLVSSMYASTYLTSKCSWVPYFIHSASRYYHNVLLTLPAMVSEWEAVESSQDFHEPMPMVHPHTPWMVVCPTLVCSWALSSNVKKMDATKMCCIFCSERFW